MKSYRIVRISGIHYPEAAISYYAQHPDLQRKSYHEQLEALSSQAFVYGDSLSREMRSLGNEAHEIIYDVDFLQQTWAMEHGMSPSQISPEDIIIAQLHFLQPDVVYFQDIYSLPYEIRKNLKSIVPSIKLIVVYKGYPGAFHEMKHIDVLFVGTPGIKQEYEKRGISAELLYHCFNPRILDLLPSMQSQNPTDITFIGSSGFGHGVTHLSRYNLLRDIMKQFPLQAYIDERDISTTGIIRENTILLLLYALAKQPDKILQFIQKNAYTPKSLKSIVETVTENKELGVLNKNTAFSWPILPLSKLYPNQCHQGVFGIEMYKTLQQSAITVNRHTDGAREWAGNLRLFEATGAGTCLITDDATNMADLFEKDTEVVVYSSVKDCKEKIAYLLRNENEREAIAQAGQKRTLKDHTIKNRCIVINEAIQKLLA